MWVVAKVVDGVIVIVDQAYTKEGAAKLTAEFIEGSYHSVTVPLPPGIRTIGSGARLHDYGGDSRALVPKRVIQPAPDPSEQESRELSEAIADAWASWREADGVPGNPPGDDLALPDSRAVGRLLAGEPVQLCLPGIL